MPDICDKLPLFAEGELSRSEDEAFRAHLPDCERCRAGFETIFEMSVIEQQLPRQPREEGSLWSSAKASLRAFVQQILRAPRMGFVGTLAAAAAVVLVVVMPRSEPRVAQMCSSIPFRLTYAGVDPTCKVQVQMGAPSKKQIDAEMMAELHARKDDHGIAAAYLTLGRPEDALVYLDRLKPSSPGERADLASDRAVAALQKAEEVNSEECRQLPLSAQSLSRCMQRSLALDDALRLIDDVLRVAPAHPAALYNRGFVLRELGLQAAAAEAFDAAAVLNEKVWSENARARSAELRHSLPSSEAWNKSYDAGAALLALPPDAKREQVEAAVQKAVEAARKHPGVLEVYFHDAGRAAPSRARLELLRPLADALDRTHGEHSLREHLDALAKRFSPQRQGFAARFTALLDPKLPGRAEVLGKLVDDLVLADEDDILVGLVGRNAEAIDWGKLEAKQRGFDELATKSSWYEIAIEELRARKAWAEGKPAEALQRLEKVHQACATGGVPYRCASVSLLLTHRYAALHRLENAYQHALMGYTRALAIDEWNLQLQFLQQLGQVAQFQGNHPLALVYLKEALARTSFCHQRADIHTRLAATELYLGLRFEEAREQLVQALDPQQSAPTRPLKGKCPAELDLTGADVLADLVRVTGFPQGEQHMEAALQAYRSSHKNPGEEALADDIEGRFLLASHPAAARDLLRKSIQRAEENGFFRSNVLAAKARAYSYTALLFDEAKGGRPAQALALLAQQLGVEEPSRCVVGVALDMERTFVAVRDSSGRLDGRLLPPRREPRGNSASELIPGDMVKALDGCDQVDVLANPEVSGSAQLLPRERAWRYRMPRLYSPPPGREREMRLVVTNVDSPRELGLERLDVAEVEVGPQVLMHGDATPPKVLEQMAQASEIEIRAHGLMAVSSEASYIVLTPDASGDYKLTPDKVRAIKLDGAPIVFLEACSVARPASRQHEFFSLPAVFIERGARAVVAATIPIRNMDAELFFKQVRDRIHENVSAAEALRDTRMAWVKEHGANDPGATWVDHVLAFE